MLIELLKVIAMACSLHTGTAQEAMSSPLQMQRDLQRGCQRDLIHCLQKEEKVMTPEALANCLGK